MLVGNNEAVATFKIGYDDISELIYSVVVALSPSPLGDEIVFFVTAAEADQSFVHNYYDGLETKNFLKNEDERRMVRAFTCKTVGFVIDRLKPITACMTTHTADLPEKALTKFDSIIAEFIGRGYLCRESEPYQGRLMWFFDRAD